MASKCFHFKINGKTFFVLEQVKRFEIGVAVQVNIEFIVQTCSKMFIREKISKAAINWENSVNFQFRNSSMMQWNNVPLNRIIFILCNEIALGWPSKEFHEFLCRTKTQWNQHTHAKNQWQFVSKTQLLCWSLNALVVYNQATGSTFSLICNTMCPLFWIAHRVLSHTLTHKMEQ